MNFESFKSLYLKQAPQEFPNKVKTNPILSVIVLTYQHVDYIEECLDGILKQETDFEFEIIIGEDDSKDGTREICIRYAKRYPEKIRLFLHHSVNKIKVSNTTTGNFNILYNYFHARGKYIAICEGDDFWTDPLKLQKQFDFMENNPVYSVCYHDYKIVDYGNQYINSEKASPLRDDLEPEELTLSFQHPATLTIFFRNVIQTKVPEEITRVLAIDVFLNSLLGQSGAGKYLDYVLPSSYRVHDGGLWSSMDMGPKLISKINTYTQLSSYFSRIGKDNIAKKFTQRNKKIKRYLIFLSAKKFQPKYLLWLIKNW